MAPKLGAVDVAPKEVPNAGADVAGVPNSPVEGWVVLVPKPNPGAAAGLKKILNIFKNKLNISRKKYS